jgi:hypothetical protein
MVFTRLLPVVDRVALKYGMTKREPVLMPLSKSLRRKSIMSRERQSF